MSASLRSRRSAERGGLLALVSVSVVAACSYDFDQFVHEPTGGAPAVAGSASHASGGTSGRGGTTGLGGSSTHGGSSGSGGSTSIGDAGDGGAAGAATSGGSGGNGGTSVLGGGGGSGNTGTAGTGGKGGSGGSAGTGGKGGSGGSGGSTGGKGGSSAGGTTSGAGQGGKPSNAGASGSSSSSCSGTPFGGHCYFLIGTDSALDWPTAKTTCETYSKTTHLVTITSTEEQAALAKAFFPATVDTWIGLALADPSRSPDSLCKIAPDQCPFLWITGEKLSYTDWTVRSNSDNEPNYSGSCVRLVAADQTWGDTSCTGTKNRAICEQE